MEGRLSVQAGGYRAIPSQERCPEILGRQLQIRVEACQARLEGEGGVAQAEEAMGQQQGEGPPLQVRIATTNGN